MRFDSKLSPPELGAVCSENCGIARIFYVQRLVRCRPEWFTFFFFQIKKHSPTVSSDIRTPPRYIEVAPSAIAGAGVGNHQRILSITENMAERDWSVLIKHAVGGDRSLRHRMNRHTIRRLVNEHRRLRRDAFEQQGLDGFYSAIRVEPPAH